MGCDIHAYREKQVGEKWLAADKWQKSEYEEGGLSVRYEDRFYTGQNYHLFGLLAKGVRSSHDISFLPRGLPHDACEEVKACAKEWDCDGHNHSYLYLHELKSALALSKKARITVTGMKDAVELKAFRESIASESPDWNLLWPYCSWTNQAGHVDFEQEIPASIYFDEALKELIEGFDGIDGDNHRLVFWFDN